jgi:hypothetical protein
MIITMTMTIMIKTNIAKKSIKNIKIVSMIMITNIIMNMIMIIKNISIKIKNVNISMNIVVKKLIMNIKNVITNTRVMIMTTTTTIIILVVRRITTTIMTMTTTMIMIMTTTTTTIMTTTTTTIMIITIGYIFLNIKISSHSKTKKNHHSTNLSMIEESDNYNLRAAMIHVLGDIL